MLHMMTIQLLPTEAQRKILDETITIFTDICNFMSEIAFRTKTTSNKIKLQKESYAIVREKFNAPSQMVVLAISKVVESYKLGGKDLIRFTDKEPVIYDKRLLAFKWIERVSISTYDGRLDIPLIVRGYSDARLIAGRAELVKLENEYYLHIAVDFPSHSSLKPIEYK